MAVKVYNRQLTISVDLHKMVMEELTGFVQKQSLKRLELPFPESPLQEEGKLKEELISALIQEGFRQLRLQKLTCKLIMRFHFSLTGRIAIAPSLMRTGELIDENMLAKLLGRDTFTGSFLLLRSTQETGQGSQPLILYSRHDSLSYLSEYLQTLGQDLSSLQIQFLSLPDLFPLVPATHRGFGILMTHSHNCLELLFLEEGQPVYYHKLELASLQEFRSQLQEQFTQFQQHYHCGSSLDFAYLSSLHPHPELIQVCSETLGKSPISLDLCQRIFPLVANPLTTPPIPAPVSPKSKNDTDVLQSGGNSPRRITSNSTAAAAGKIESDPSMKKKINPRWLAYGLALLAVIALLLYEPDDHGALETKVDEQMMTDPLLQLGIPKGSPDNYRSMLEQLEQEKSKATAEGKPFPEFKEKQRVHLQNMKQKGEF